MNPQSMVTRRSHKSAETSHYKSSGSDFTFIHQPTLTTESDGTLKSNWVGVEKFWENETLGWGVRTTETLPRKFCIPYGGTGPITDEMYDALRKRGGDSLYFVVQYLIERAKDYKTRLYYDNHPTEEPFIYLDAHPNKAKEAGFPQDCWIGSFVNTATEGENNNCDMEVISVEYADKRNYPYCEYFLFIVLDKELPPFTPLRVPYRLGANSNTRRIGRAPTTPTSGKRKEGNNRPQISIITSKDAKEEIQIKSNQVVQADQLSLTSDQSSDNKIMAAQGLLQIQNSRLPQHPTLQSVRDNLRCTIDSLVPRRKPTSSSSSASSASCISLVDDNGAFIKRDLLEDNYTRDDIENMIAVLVKTEKDLDQIVG